MPNCFWNGKCNCPDTTPTGAACSQHGLYNCSMFNGRFIRRHRVQDVNDRNTRVMEAIIAQMEQEFFQLDNYQQTIDDLKQQAENKKTALENFQRTFLSNPSAQNEAIAERLKDESNALAQRFNDESKNVIDLLETFDEKHTDIIEWAFSLLRIPYTGIGTCECYAEKIGFLGPLGTQINRQLTRIDNIQDNITILRISIIALLVTLAAQTIGAVLLVFFGPPGWAAIIALLILMFLEWLVLFGLVSRHIFLSRQLRNLKIATLKNMLIYYRVQSISTCEPLPIGEGSSDDDNDDDDNEEENVGHGSMWEEYVVGPQYSMAFKQRLDDIAAKHLKSNKSSKKQTTSRKQIKVKNKKKPLKKSSKPVTKGKSKKKQSSKKSR